MFQRTIISSRRRRTLRAVALLALLGLLSGCIIVPAYDAPPRYHGYYYWR